MLEIRPIKDFPAYGVSSDGRVWRISDPVTGPHARKKLPYEIRGCEGRGGYLHVDLHGRCVKVATLVAVTFIGPRPSGKEVAHYDGNRQNNRVENLRWATRPENAADKRRHGTHASGARIGTAVLSRGDVEWIHAFPKYRGAAKDMARRLQVCTATIYGVLKGATYAY